MAKETGHIVSKSNKIASKFLYDDILVPLIRDGQKGKKTASYILNTLYRNRKKYMLLKPLLWDG